MEGNGGVRASVLRNRDRLLPSAPMKATVRTLIASRSALRCSQSVERIRHFSIKTSMAPYRSPRIGHGSSYSRAPTVFRKDLFWHS